MFVWNAITTEKIIEVISQIYCYGLGFFFFSVGLSVTLLRYLPQNTVMTCWKPKTVRSHGL